mgnify:CR=1 FL=1
MIDALQFLYLILFKPSAWRSLVKSIDPALTDGFCLLHLRREHLKNKQLRNLLVLGFILLPTIYVIIEQIVRIIIYADLVNWNFFFREYALNAAAKAAGMLRLGGMLAIFISVYIGIVAMLIDILTNEAVHHFVGYIMKSHAEGSWHSTTDVYVQSYPTMLIVMIAFSASFSFFARMRFYPDRLKLDTRTIGATILGLGAIGGLGLVQLLVLQTRDIFIVAGFSVFCLIGFCLFIGATFRLRKVNWATGMFLALFICVVYSLLTATGSSVTQYLLDPRQHSNAVSDALQNAYRQAIASLLAVVLMAPVIAGNALGGSFAAAVAGGVGAPLCWLFITIYTDIDFPVRGPLGQSLVYKLTLACILLGWSLPYWQRYALYYLGATWNRLLYQLDLRRSASQTSLLRWHSVFWDELQTSRLEGLSEHLLLVCQRWPEVGKQAMEQLAAGPQRWAPQVVQLEFELLTLEQCADMTSLAGIQKQLGDITTHGIGPERLRFFGRLSRDITVAMASQKNPYLHRLALRGIEEQMDRFIRDLTLSSDMLAARFLRILYRWRDILSAHQSEYQLQQTTTRFIEDPYIVGLPLAEAQSVFVGRSSVGAQIEKLIITEHAPPLLLYGQRRMGKTSLLRNLRTLLPSSWVTLFVDLQGLCSSQDHAGFLFQLAKAMSRQLQSQRGVAIGEPTRQELASDPFVVFDDWLDRFSDQLCELSALLMLDEFEQLDAALQAGRYDAQLLLGMLRHMIQHKPKFRVLLAGSHLLSEVSVWASYLINARTIKLGCLHADESRHLVEKPFPGFALRYQPEALDLVLCLTSGHPYLLQLLCARIIETKNKQDEALRFLATVADVESAVAPALDDAVLVFGEIATNQISSQGRALLKLLALRGQGAFLRPCEEDGSTGDGHDQAWHQLVQRDLVELTADGYRFQIELFRRWFASSRAQVLV